MRILITGCRGQLGTELQKQLSAGLSELGKLPSVYADAYVKGIDIDDFDLSDKDALYAFLDEESYDLVVNCAAFTNVDGCETSPDTAYAANAIAVRNLADACEQTATKLAHLSTDYVFPGDAQKPYKEYDLTCPETVYGKTKLAGEQYVLQRCRRAFVIRTQWLYGYTGKNFVRTIMAAAKENGALKVVDDQFGCPTNAVDLAHHILKIAASNRYGVYHCANQGVTSWYEFTREILRLAGIKAEVQPCATAEYPRPAKRPAYSALDNMMLRLTVGDEMRLWQDALAAFIQNLDKESEQ